MPIVAVSGAERQLPPVETVVGEVVRQGGLKSLTGRYEVLVARSRRRALIPGEALEAKEVAAALDELTAMAPVGPLLEPGRTTLALPRPGRESR